MNIKKDQKNLSKIQNLVQLRVPLLFHSFRSLTAKVQPINVKYFFIFMKNKLSVFGIFVALEIITIMRFFFLLFLSENTEILLKLQ